MAMFAWFKGRSGTDAAADALYRAVIAQARQPVFYESLGVPDTVDGRFDMVALHAFLVLRRLRRDGPAGQDLGQALYDLMFADMDVNLREMGIGDMGIGRRIKAMAQMFSGRVAAYDAGLESADDGDLGQALRRNLYRKTEPEDVAIAALAAYMRRADRCLAGCDLAALETGAADFGPAPAAPAP
ncbi:MAG: ubiquinol-cytochrome C chaperone family protein [Hyphomicrobiales bacterium]|nr:ubiquinol-cytochrome C chaperone family protein [Hyphomicrobiales bacterium]